jgi:hypothetical protein
MPSLIDRTRLLAQRTRQHHAIEHATLHLLAAQFPRRSFAGVSDPLGFTIYGDVNEETLRRAVSDALLRLQAGEEHLALHPNCGTNLATGAVLATGAAWLGLAGRRPGIDKFGAAVALVVAALVIAQPLGMRLQAFTTSAAVADRWVAQIRPIQTGALAGHRVVFE